MSDTSTVVRADVSHCEKLLCQMAMVDREKFAVGKLPTTEEGFHEELIIHSLEAQVWGDFCI